MDLSFKALLEMLFKVLLTLGQLKESGGEVSALAESFMSANGTDLPEFSVVPDVIGIIWWLSVLAIILLPIWGPKASD